MSHFKRSHVVESDAGSGLYGPASEGEGPFEVPEGDRKFVSALARGLEVLRAFRPGGGPLGNAELSEATGIPKATITRLTYTLTQLGYLKHLAGTGRYEPTAAILALGYPVLSNLRVRHVAHDYMQQLANQAGCSVALASPDRLSMIYVDVCPAQALTTLHLDIGSRFDIVFTSAGRAFLAGIAKGEREYFFGHFARRYGAEWPDLRIRVEASMAEVAERGFCFVENERGRDVRAIGVPLVSPDGRTVMAMNCGGPCFSITRERLEQEIGPRLVHLCRSIAPLLG